MSKNKKRVYSTNRDSARKITPAVATDPVEVKAVEADPVEVEAVEADPVEVEAVEADPVEVEAVEAAEADPVEKDQEVICKFTLDEAIEWFRNDPHPEEFFCTGPSGFALVHGNFYLKFEKGKFVTSDPAEVEILMRAREFNLFIYAVNATLRNLKK